MKSISLILASLLLANVLQAQAPATGEKLPAVKLKIKGVEVEEQPTPMISATNVKMKRWTPKNWIELDVEFDIKLPEEAGGRKGTYAAMQLNIYVALQHMNKEGKREVITGTLDLVDIPAGVSNLWRRARSLRPSRAWATSLGGRTKRLFQCCRDCC
jgi:hypothetical protein